MKSKTAGTFLLLFLCLVLAAGCPFRRPELKPAPRQESPREEKVTEEVPPIPKAISKGANKEPELRVYVADRGAVLTMPFEEYLMGVVAAEMDPDWPKEALAAQAIIARSFTLQKIAEEGGVPARQADASTDIEEFQAYDAGRINENVREAVESTRGLVAVHSGKFIRGWFHAYAGPRTATAREGLDFRGPNPPYIKIVESPAQDTVPEEEKNWQASFPLSEVRSVVREATGKDPGNVTSVSIEERGPSGRVTKFKVNDVTISGPQLRLGLGSTKMRSTFVNDLRIQDNRLHLSGTGYGHGVGMCQWGAKTLADQGKSAEEIVHYYYRNIDIVKLWE